MPRYVKDQRPVVGPQQTSDDGSDLEDSTQLVYLKSSPLSVDSDISTLPADADVASSSDTDDSSTDKSYPRMKALSSHLGGVPG